MSAESGSFEPTQLTPAEDNNQKTALRVITWFSVGMALATVGIFVGREIFTRYKFKRRTPYDFYSNAGFGVGI
jgi:hypothetical protein